MTAIRGNPRRFPLLALLVLCLGLAYAAGFYVSSHPARATTLSGDGTPTGLQPDSGFDLFWEAWHTVRGEFYGPLPQDRQLAYAALRGALAALRDPYTVLVEPQPHEMEKAELHGSFGGIGVNLSRDAKGRVILHPLPDSPASRAGVTDGDVLLALDGFPLTPTLTLEAITIWLRGPVGQPVTLSLQRPEGGPARVVTITRAEIDLPSVTWRQLDQDPSLGYIALSRFSERTDAELRQALRDLRSRGVQRLVLDLRNNGGGLLQAAVDVAGEFLSDQVVLYEDRRKLPEETYHTEAGGLATDIPLVVLVNRGTASAAEIVAAALQDYGRAALIGEATFGKGSVQLIFELSDGSSLHVTAARWLTPRRRSLDGAGLNPDIFQEGEAQGGEPGPGDAQLARAVSYLQTK